MNKFSRGDFYFILIQLFNTCLLLLGLALLTSSIYLSKQTNSINTFTVCIGFVAIFLLLTSGYGYFCIKNSPCSIIIYEFFVLCLTLTLIPLGFYIMFDQEDIVNFLIEKMKDSEEAINKAKKAIDMNMDITKITLLVYSTILVGNICVNMNLGCLFCISLLL